LTAIGPNLLCQRSFFTHPPHARLPLYLSPRRRDPSLRPVLQHVPAQQTNLLEHQILRRVGLHGRAIAVQHSLDHRGDLLAQPRMLP
jgi:hypothetical protein